MLKSFTLCEPPPLSEYISKKEACFLMKISKIPSFLCSNLLDCVSPPLKGEFPKRTPFFLIKRFLIPRDPSPSSGLNTKKCFVKGFPCRDRHHLFPSIVILARQFI